MCFLPAISNMKRTKTKEQKLIINETILKQRREDALVMCLCFGIVIVTTTFLSCAKNEIQDNNRRYDSYKLIRDWYTLDTEFVSKAILWQDDSIWRNETKLALDTTADTWWLMCGTEQFTLHIEHWYFMKNGKKIHPSLYPKT